VNRALQLRLAPHQGIELPRRGTGSEVRGEGRQGIGRPLPCFDTLGFGGKRRSLLRLFLERGLLRDAVGDETQHVQPGDTLGAQQGHRVGVGLLKDCSQQVARLDLLLLRALGVLHGALDHPVEGQGLAGLHRLLAGLLVEILVEEALEGALEPREVGSAAAQHLAPPRVVGEGEEQMLHRQVGMAPHHRFAHRRLERQLELAVQLAHSSSSPARSG
jgi:hypothetical protein